MRDFQLRWLPINLIGLAVVALVGVALPFVILVAVGTVMLALDAAWLTIKIAREDRG